MNTLLRQRRLIRTLSAVVVLVAATALSLAPSALAEPEDCNETLTLYDPYDLVWDTDVPVDFSTLSEVEGLVDDYTERIDDVVDAESEDIEPPDDVSSDELIDEGRWEIEDAIDLGRSMAGCED